MASKPPSNPDDEDPTQRFHVIVVWKQNPDDGSPREPAVKYTSLDKRITIIVLT